MTTHPNQSRTSWIIRAVCIFTYGLIAYGMMFFWDHLMDAQFGWLALFVFPISIGVAGQVMFDPMRQYTSRRVFYGAMIVQGMLAIGLLFMAIETLICIVIAAPFLFLGTYVGIVIARLFIGQFTDRIGSGKLHASLLLLPLALGMPNDLLQSRTESYAVQSHIIVDASPADIWAQLFDVAQIQPEERIWTVSHDLLGAPRAIKAEMGDGYRKAYWEMGIAFGERLTETVDARLIAWDFEFPDDFEMDGYDTHIRPRGETLNVFRGRYEITPLDANRSLLTLTTDYTLTTPMNGYVAFWGHRFLDDFHNSVLHVIKLRTEKV